MAGLPTALLIGVAAALSTMAGGTLAIRFRAAQSLLFGFSSGAVVGVALLDLLPEALDLAEPAFTSFSVMTAAVCGFAGYSLLDRSAALLGNRRFLGPGSLTTHSVLEAVMNLPQVERPF